jgi:hypothetical protein
MSARDDASKPATATRTPGTGRRVAAAVLAGACLGFVASALVVQHVPAGPWPRYEVRVAWEGGPPAPAEWPRAARPGEGARCAEQGGRTVLVVRAVRGEDAGELASALQRRRLSGVDAAAMRRAAVRSRWRAGRLPGPEPWLSRAARTAALVRGRLLLVMLLDPGAPAAAPPTSGASGRAQARLDAAAAEVARLALAAQPDSLEAALTACAAAENEWLRQVAAQPAGVSRAQLEAAWRWHERRRAPALDAIERRLESRLTTTEETLVPPVAFDRALRLERLAPDPAAIVFVSGRWRTGVEPSPIARTWALLLGPGVLAGAAAGLALAVRRPRHRARRVPLRLVRGIPAGLSLAAGRPEPPRLLRDPERAWRTELGWLHVVSGPDRARIAHGVGTLAEGLLARGERVLVVDAGPDLRLHERFGGDARWGLGECLAGEVPLLGAVQAAGRPGFYLLGRGAVGASGRWEALSAVLEEVRRHFDRVILAVGTGVPNAAALPLGGRVLEAWWAEPGTRLPRRAEALSERLGIPFANLNLNWLTHVEREGPEPASGEPAVISAAEAGPVAGVAPPAVTTDAAATVVPGVAPGVPDQPPPVLGCDPDVRDRLRFLVWTRRVRAERRAAPVEVGTGG